jgi:elongation factor G
LTVKDADTKFVPIVFPTSRQTVAVKAENDSDDEKVGEL